MEKAKPLNVKKQASQTAVPPKPAQPPKPAPGAAPPPAPPARVPPLFRPIDWMTLLFTFTVVWTVYLLTLAPEVTLQDSGELCTGAFYAGIPHAPGYPFWTIYAWLWTVVLPIGNVAWRVEVGEAAAAAMACGLVAFMVSRGSSMLMEGIEELRALTGRWESAICVVCGTVAGLLLGFNGVMWSESVAINRISLFGVPWVTIVLLCLLRWIYAPHQRRYLYCAMFFFGICATIHQTLLVAAMGIEVAIAATQPRLGRNFFLGNSIIYGVGLLWKSTHFFTMLDTAPMVLGLYHAVGLGSIAAYAWLAVRTRERFDEFCRDGALAALALSLAAVPSLKSLGILLALGALGAFAKLAWNTRKLGLDWLVVILCGLLWMLGASFYFYEPIAGMTNPPMQWGYPRTVEGFFHALSRGQYERANPTDVFGDPGRFLMQLGLLVGELATQYNWVLVLLALVPLLFLLKMQKRERAWLVGLVAIYLCIGVLLVVLMNPPPDRGGQDLMRVFFTSSHAVVAILIGYGLALISAFMATHYQRFRAAGLTFGAAAIFPAFASFYSSLAALFGWGGVSNPLILLVLFLLMLACLAVALHQFMNWKQAQGERAIPWLGILAASLAVAFLGWAADIAFFAGERPVNFSHLWTFIGQCFASKYQYGLPVYAGVVLVGSLLIFLGTLLTYRQRAPLAITLGLFALMPLYSGLCHWAGSEQRNHWFGYWFGHDMFTSPFKDQDGKPLYPDMAKDAILYGGTDPGRFCPTYMIFCESFIPHHNQPPPPAGDQTFDRRDVYLITQNALADPTYLCYLRAQYNRSQQIDPPFFSELARTILKDQENETNLLARVLQPLDRVFTDLGARVEKRRRTFTSWFTPKDFINLPDFVAKLRPRDQQDRLAQWLFQNFSHSTQNLLTGQGNEEGLRRALAKDLNQLLERELESRELLNALQREKDQVDQAISAKPSDRLRRKQDGLTQQIAELSKVEPLYQTNRFAAVKLSDYLLKFIAQNPQSDTRIRLNRLLLEAAFPNDLAKRLGGVYPDREIYMATPDDTQNCYSEYMRDAQRRFLHDQQFPNEPKQIKPGEDARIVNDGGQQRVQVSGQVAVMGINGLLTRIIFEHNPDNEFYVEESYPLDWMYPYLTPFCDIMKINRRPVPEITEDMVRRDHEFWCQNSARLIGNWITYDTPVSNIVAFVEQTYLRRNFQGFTGDRAFIRDDQAQKSFAKLRSSIANSIYTWRIGTARTAAEQQRMIKEADFACKQAFAFCPYSPEAVFRYAQLLVSPAINRVEDAYLVATTCLKLDPHNTQAQALVQNLNLLRGQPAPGAVASPPSLPQLEAEAKSKPTDLQASLSLASAYLARQQTNLATDVLDRLAANSQSNLTALLTVAQAYSQLGDFRRLEALLERMTRIAPDQPEVWYDLSAIKAMFGKNSEAVPALQRCLLLNARRLAANPKAQDLSTQVVSDARFNSVRQLPEIQRLLPTRK